jgi:hypothetical protein
LEADEFRVGYDMETEFPARLTRVKAKTLSGIKSGSRVRSGSGRVTGSRLFPYLGAIGLAGLGRITTQVTGLRNFPYPCDRVRTG